MGDFLWCIYFYDKVIPAQTHWKVKTQAEIDHIEGISKCPFVSPLDEMMSKKENFCSRFWFCLPPHLDDWLAAWEKILFRRGQSSETVQPYSAVIKPFSLPGCVMRRQINVYFALFSKSFKPKSPTELLFTQIVKSAFHLGQKYMCILSNHRSILLNHFI